MEQTFTPMEKNLFLNNLLKIKILIMSRRILFALLLLSFNLLGQKSKNDCCSSFIITEQLLPSLEKASKIVKKNINILKDISLGQNGIIVNKTNLTTFLKKNKSKDIEYLLELFNKGILQGESGISLASEKSTIFFTIKEYEYCVHVVCHDPMELYEIGQNSATRTLSTKRFKDGWVYRINKVVEDERKRWPYKN